MLKSISLAAALSFASSSAFACFPIPCGIFLGTDDVNAGVLCQINDVTALAANADDCAKAGGSVTHSVTTTKTPAK